MESKQLPSCLYAKLNSANPPRFKQSFPEGCYSKENFLDNITAGSYN